MFKLIPRQSIPSKIRGKYATAIAEFITSNDDCVEIVLGDVRIESAYISFCATIRNKFKDSNVKALRINYNLYLVKE
jgi:hypothetical protein